MQLQESGEMYLESIYVLSKKSNAVRAIDICEYMGFSKPSISRAIGLLKSGEFIWHDSKGRVDDVNPKKLAVSYPFSDEFIHFSHPKLFESYPPHHNK